MAALRRLKDEAARASGDCQVQAAIGGDSERGGVVDGKYDLSYPTDPSTKRSTGQGTSKHNLPKHRVLKDCIWLSFRTT